MARTPVLPKRLMKERSAPIEASKAAVGYVRFTTPAVL